MKVNCTTNHQIARVGSSQHPDHVCRARWSFLCHHHTVHQPVLNGWKSRQIRRLRRKGGSTAEVARKLGHFRNSYITLNNSETPEFLQKTSTQQHTHTPNFKRGLQFFDVGHSSSFILISSSKFLKTLKIRGYIGVLVMMVWCDVGKLGLFRIF